MAAGGGPFIRLFHRSSREYGLPRFSLSLPLSDSVSILLHLNWRVYPPARTPFSLNSTPLSLCATHATLTCQHRLPRAHTHTARAAVQSLLPSPRSLSSSTSPSWGQASLPWCYLSSSSSWFTRWARFQRGLLLALTAKRMARLRTLQPQCKERNFDSDFNDQR